MLAMLLAATAGLAAAAAAVRPSPPSLSFRTPALVHNAGSTLASQAATLTADGRVIALPIGMPNANLALSTDAGASWVEQNVSGLGIDVNTTYSGKIKMPGDERWGGDHCPNPMRVGPAGKTRLLDRGLQRTDPKTNASWSMAPGTRAEYAWEGGKLTVTPLTGVEGAASFTGLPRKAVANEGVPSDLIRFAGGASLVLSADGRTILQTASFAFGDNPTSSYAQSTTAYLSTDGGNHFAYLSTVAAAGDYLDSQEGPGGGDGPGAAAAEGWPAVDHRLRAARRRGRRPALAPIQAVPLDNIDGHRSDVDEAEADERDGLRAPPAAAARRHAATQRRADARACGSDQQGRLAGRQRLGRRRERPRLGPVCPADILGAA
eukprot:COSAG06_NODE_11915_length_1447_cov_9.785899_1_plen_377_part_00